MKVTKEYLSNNARTTKVGNLSVGLIYKHYNDDHSAYTSFELKLYDDFIVTKNKVTESIPIGRATNKEEFIEVVYNFLAK